MFYSPDHLTLLKKLATWSTTSAMDANSVAKEAILSRTSGSPNNRRDYHFIEHVRNSNQMTNPRRRRLLKRHNRHRRLPTRHNGVPILFIAIERRDLHTVKKLAAYGADLSKQHAQNNARRWFLHLHPAHLESAVSST